MLFMAATTFTLTHCSRTDKFQVYGIHLVGRATPGRSLNPLENSCDFLNVAFFKSRERVSSYKVGFDGVSPGTLSRANRSWHTGTTAPRSQIISVPRFPTGTRYRISSVG